MWTDEDKKRSEDSFLFQDIARAFEQFGYPRLGDKENIKIKGDIKIKMGSGLKEPDLVYYTNGDPILLVEAKKVGQPDPTEQAFSYVKLFPAEKYSANKVRPKYFACTEGPQITKFCKYVPSIDDRGELIEGIVILDKVLTYQQLLEELGMAKIKTPLTASRFKQDVFYPIVRCFIKEDHMESAKGAKLESRYILKTVRQIYEFLRHPDNYTTHQPYVDLDGHPDLQQEIRRAFESYDWNNCDHIEIAQEFRSDIHRAFQKGELNQYITPTEVVRFMTNLISLKTDDSVLDFECGSGGFLFATLQNGVSPKNITGVDLDDLPYYSAKVLLALHLGVFEKDIDDKIKIEKRNGLLNFDEEYDIVLSNPSGSSQYPEEKNQDLEKVKNDLEIDLDGNGKDDSKVPSEYYFSIQRAVKSCKVGGKIVILLPEGFFSNSSDTNLRNYVAKYCRVSALISLPRGIFYKGSDTKTINSGKQQSNQKMSVLLAQKKLEVEPRSGIEINNNLLDDNVFLASISESKNLENKLKIILDEYKYWQTNSELDLSKKVGTQIEIVLQKKPIQQELIKKELPLFKEQEENPKISIVTRISKGLEGLFKN
ncbi:MAG: N-6 DNA methylase [Candidatus Shapirobacteria bacterium]|jgi:type I restriction-modification system DNA methylase subunit